MIHQTFMPISFITGSDHKFAEINAVVGNLVKVDIDLPEIQDVNPEPIIAAKLNEAAARYPNHELIVEDTSLFLDGLNGLPGPLIKWFLQALGREGLYQVVANSGNFGAEARTTIGYLGFNTTEPQFFTGSTRGRIFSPRGESDFGWDPLFMPDGQDQTYAEMTADQKNAVSHRGKAARALRQFIDQSA
jgi:inosine triphosphate pyrophosphatase